MVLCGIVSIVGYCGYCAVLRILCGIVWYCMVLCGIVGIVGAVWYCMVLWVLYGIVWYCVVLWVLCGIVWYCGLYGHLRDDGEGGAEPGETEVRDVHSVCRMEGYKYKLKKNMILVL